jgi:hypothetical protein
MSVFILTDEIRAQFRAMRDLAHADRLSLGRLLQIAEEFHKNGVGVIGEMPGRRVVIPPSDAWVVYSIDEIESGCWAHHFSISISTPKRMILPAVASLLVKEIEPTLDVHHPSRIIVEKSRNSADRSVLHLFFLEHGSASRN